LAETIAHMTHEQLIAKAVEHAKACGVPVEQLNTPKVRDVVLVSFTSQHSLGKAKFYVDADTGEVIGGECSGPEFTPRATGKQFSKRAQRVLALASEESRRLGCEHVGSDHLLLGVLLFGEGNGAGVLSGAGLSLEPVRARLSAVGPAPEVAPTGYGPTMRNILRLSSHYAGHLRHAEIEPEHLVLGLLDEGDGPAVRLFQHFGVDVGRTKATLLQKMSQ
jgi:hypothetical protein